jgi:hypothetical protein
LLLHTIYIYQSNQINQKQTNHHQFEYNQISSIFDVTYILHLTNQSNQSKTNKSSSISKSIKFHQYLMTYFLNLSNQSNQSKTNKSSSIWISIKFHKYLMIHTLYIYQIYQINQKQTNHHQFQYQSNFINIWCYIQSTFIKSIKNKQIIINLNVNQIS